MIDCILNVLYLAMLIPLAFKLGPIVLQKLVEAGW